MNIIDLSSNPPVKKPDVIVECKELSDWFNRVREVRGPIAKPLTIEAWRSKWIEGLWMGLVGILGVKRRRVEELREDVKAVRLRDLEIVKLYKSFYEPREMIIVSRVSVPCEVKEGLEDSGIKVVDGVGFDEEELSEVESLVGEARGEDRIQVGLNPLTYKVLERA